MQEYKQDQRYAICLSRWKKKVKTASYVVEAGGDQYAYFDEPTES